MSDSRSEIDTSSYDSRTTDETVDELPEEPTEQELREAYDNDEIDRFLTLFSNFVQEVTALDDVPPSKAPSPDSPPHKKDSTPSDVSDNESWKETHDQQQWPPSRTAVGKESEGLRTNISRAIAKVCIVPVLPPPRPPPPAFTISRLCVTVQRLYLVTHEPYGRFFNNLFTLASWKNFGKSFVWCSIYWILWWHDLLLSGAVLWILTVLLKRRVLLYPSLEELHRHRERVADANKFGRQMSDRLTAPSSGLKDIWHLFRAFESSRKRKIVAGAIKGKAKVKQATTAPEDLKPEAALPSEPTVLDGDLNSKEEQDVKKAIIFALSEIADLHERVANIFIWRRPAVSYRYAAGLCVVLSIVTLLPARYLMKLLFFVVGALFWHIVPIIASLSPEERSRLPPALGDAPTDAEYAMELISARVATGLEVRPRPRGHAQKPPRLPPRPSGLRAEEDLTDPANKNVDWKKWGNRLQTGKSVIGDLKRLKLGQVWPVQEGNIAQHPLVPDSVRIVQPQANVETHSYPCQHTSSPGLITLSPTTLFFTPITSQFPTISVPLNTIKGIKKQGLLKGLNIKWNEESDGRRETKEERFHWVGSRDDLFARLVGTEGRKWVTL